MRLVTQTVDPTHSVDQPALDELNLVLLRPAQALVEGPISGIKRVRVKPDFHIYVHYRLTSITSARSLLNAYGVKKQILIREVGSLQGKCRNNGCSVKRETRTEWGCSVALPGPAMGLRTFLNELVVFGWVLSFEGQHSSHLFGGLDSQAFYFLNQDPAVAGLPDARGQGWCRRK